MLSQTFSQAIDQLLNIIVPARRRRAQLNARLWGWATPKKGGSRAD